MVIISGDGMVHFLHIKEKSNQGYTLVVIIYGMGILPLIRDLWTGHHGVSQPWYDDYAVAGGTLSGIQ